MRGFRRVGLCLLLAAIGCTGPADSNGSAKKTCQKAADCAAGICDISTGSCVACLGNNDCDTGQVCSANKCEAKVTCTSAKQCPGRVCAEAIGACSDCNADADCSTGKHCVANSCVPLPKTCAGDAECTSHSLVCEPTDKVCVECAKDGDCIDAVKPVCNSAHVCVARTCTPKAVECLDSGTIRTCDTRGSAWTVQSCGGGTICENSQCIPQVCAPGARRCDGSSVVKTCNAKGLGEDSTDCAVAGKVCRSGACADITCGDGIKSGAEECDDGNDVNTDSCTNSCTNAKCGDGIVQGDEDCDGGPGCSASCTRLNATSCKSIKDNNPSAPDGLYDIDPDGNGGVAPEKVFCDMTTDGGGWAWIAYGRDGTSSFQNWLVDGAVNVGSMGSTAASWHLSTAFIRALAVENRYRGGCSRYTPGYYWTGAGQWSWTAEVTAATCNSNFQGTGTAFTPAWALNCHWGVVASAANGFTAAHCNNGDPAVVNPWFCNGAHVTDVAVWAR